MTNHPTYTVKGTPHVDGKLTIANEDQGWSLTYDCTGPGALAKVIAALEDAAKLLDEAPTPAHTCWLCEKPCEPHAFYLAPDNETAQAICEPCGEENTTDTCGCCGAKGDSVEINELIEITDDRFPAQTYIAMCSKCEVESDRLSRELDQETP